MVASSGEDTVAHGQQVLTLVNEMQQLIENTLNQANQIVQESEKGVTKEVQESFHQVNNVSGDLLAIAKTEKISID